MTELQTRILEIFKAVSSICEDEGLQYFAIGGTCLGAVRHHGFIPWDDDVDIAMPIDDFLRFLDIAGSRLPAHLSLIGSHNRRYFNQMFFKVIDNRTTAIEVLDVPYKEAYKGIWIDIMPICSFPSQKALERFIPQDTFLWTGNIFLRFGVPKKSTLIKDITCNCYRFPALVRDFRFYSRLWLKKLRKNGFHRDGVTGYVWSPSHLEAFQIPAVWFADSVLMDFEDTQMRCPAGWDGFLKAMFGNYMDFPPPEQRNSGHMLAKVDLEHPYKDYQNGLLKINLNGQ